MKLIITTYWPGWPGSLKITADVLVRPETKELTWMTFGKGAPGSYRQETWASGML